MGTWEIDARAGLGGCRVSVGGHEIADELIALALVRDSTGMTLDLRVKPTAVHVLADDLDVTITAASTGEAIAAWLDAIDPKALEAAALEAVDDYGGVTVAILRTLAARAAGEA